MLGEEPGDEHVSHSRQNSTGITRAVRGRNDNPDQVEGVRTSGVCDRTGNFNERRKVLGSHSLKIQEQAIRPE